MTQVLAYGGGRQTVAMVLLVTQGKLPRPDRIVIADTSREADSTWAYLDRYVQPHLAEFGMTVERAPHSLATVDIYGTTDALLIPAYTASGKLPAFCSREWKVRVCERWLRQSGVSGALTWVGYTLEERKRATDRGRKPWFRDWPLIHMMLTRTDCERIILNHGWPLPEKSSCWMCPNQSNAQWRRIRDEEPEHFAQAIALDEEIRVWDERGGVWLHSSRVPLADADLDATDRKEPNRQCGLGMCQV